MCGGGCTVVKRNEWTEGRECKKARIVNVYGTRFNANVFRLFWQWNELIRIQWVHQRCHFQNVVILCRFHQICLVDSVTFILSALLASAHCKLHTWHCAFGCCLLVLLFYFSHFIFSSACFSNSFIFSSLSAKKNSMSESTLSTFTRDVAKDGAI